MKKYFTTLFFTTWKECEDNSSKYMSENQTKMFDYKVIVILVYIAFGISITRYFGHTTDFLDYVVKNPSKFDFWFCSFFFGNDFGKFHSMLYWIFVIICFYLVFPIIIVKVVFKDKLRDYGFIFKGIQKDYPLYLLMLFIMIPIVYLASSTQSFQNKYPLFKPEQINLFPVFIYWQIAYFIQFVAVEFFFRGFILHGLKNRFGVYAIFIMTIPYCLVHFGKPFGETIAAIFAGIILGTLSIKSRSIVLGILISLGLVPRCLQRMEMILVIPRCLPRGHSFHYSIAIAMDLFALWRVGILKI